MDIKAIRARAEAATSGKWESTASAVWRVIQVDEDEFEQEKIADLGCSEDAEFSAKAKQDIPDLLDALEEAVGLLKEVTFQFEPLLQDLAEEHYLDDEVQDALVKQLKGIEAFLATIKGE